MPSHEMAPTLSLSLPLSVGKRQGLLEVNGVRVL